MLLCFIFFSSLTTSAAPLDLEVDRALKKAGANRAEIARALSEVPAAELEGMRFLIAYMPIKDLKLLSAKFLLEHVHYAYESRKKWNWAKSVPKDIFLNNVLPYASLSERREAWRAAFFKRFGGVVRGAETPGEAAVLLNKKIFSLIKVRYSKDRTKPDQGPFESLLHGTASCTGLSILLIAAARSVGIPVRFAGTPMWSNNSGNHSWVEVWDQGNWHYTGAAEPTAGGLDEAWFGEMAAKAIKDNPRHAIYAVSYQPTALKFPMAWAPRDRTYYAINVTDRYTQGRSLAARKGKAVVNFKVQSTNGKRVRTDIEVLDEFGNSVYKGKTKSERNDANDHAHTTLIMNQSYVMKVKIPGTKQWQEQEFIANNDGMVLTIKY